MIVRRRPPFDGEDDRAFGESRPSLESFRSADGSITLSDGFSGSSTSFGGFRTGMSFGSPMCTSTPKPHDRANEIAFVTVGFSRLLLLTDNAVGVVSAVPGSATRAPRAGEHVRPRRMPPGLPPQNPAADHESSVVLLWVLAETIGDGAGGDADTSRDVASGTSATASATSSAGAPSTESGRVTDTACRDAATSGVHAAFAGSNPTLGPNEPLPRDVLAWRLVVGGPLGALAMPLDAFAVAAYEGLCCPGNVRR